MRRLILLLSLAMTFATYNASPGSAEELRPACGMCEGPDRFVRLQTVVPAESGDEPTQCMHPLRIEPSDWAILLESIHVQSQPEALAFRGSGGTVLPAFATDEIEFLSEALGRAFATARSNEIVVFLLSRPRTAELTEFTTGSMFARNGALHITLPNYRKAVTLPGIRRHLWDHPLFLQPGRQYDFIPGEFQAVSQKPWRVLGIPAWDESAQLTIHYQQLTDATKIQPPPGPQTPLEPDSTATLEDRLERLKRLRERGLITEEDYAAKKSALLEAL